VAMSKNIKWALGIVAALIVVAALVVYLKLVVTLPDDGADAKLAHYENLNRVRYVEIFVVGGNGITGKMLINVYNTIESPGFDPKTNKDSAPQSWVEGVKTALGPKRVGISPLITEQAAATR
jgi:hypothetical protein